MMQKTSVIAKVGGAHCPVNIIQKYFLVLNCKQSDCYFLPKITRGKVDFSKCATYHYSVRKFKDAVAKIGGDPKVFGEHSAVIG